jgi:hypothetical protein
MRSRKGRWCPVINALQLTPVGTPLSSPTSTPMRMRTWTKKMMKMRTREVKVTNQQRMISNVRKISAGSYSVDNKHNFLLKLMLFMSRKAVKFIYIPEWLRTEMVGKMLTTREVCT